MMARGKQFHTRQSGEVYASEHSYERLERFIPCALPGALFREGVASALDLQFHDAPLYSNLKPHTMRGRTEEDEP